MGVEKIHVVYSGVGYFRSNLRPLNWPLKLNKMSVWLHLVGFIYAPLCIGMDLYLHVFQLTLNWYWLPLKLLYFYVLVYVPHISILRTLCTTSLSIVHQVSQIGSSVSTNLPFFSNSRKIYQWCHATVVLFPKEQYKLNTNGYRIQLLTQWALRVD